MDRVNGLYGPGTMLGWYLNLLACLTSWILHPHHKRKDSINADLLSLLLFPLAAASHLISLARNVSQNATLYEDSSDLSKCQTSRALEAPARIAFVWANISVIFIYPLPAIHHPRRGSAVILVLIVCLAAEFYAHGALYDIPSFYRYGGDFFREKEFANVSCTTLMVFDILQVVEYGFSLRKVRRGPGVLEEQSLSPAGTQGQIASLAARDQAIEPLSRRIFRVRGALIVWGLFTYWKGPGATALGPFLIYGWKILFSDTSSSLRDVEQVVAALGGGILLGFNLYSAGSYRYKERQRRISTQKPDVVPLQPVGRTWHGQSDEE